MTKIGESKLQRSRLHKPMLGREANGIFWMYRYLERAENVARLLAAAHRMTLTRGGDAASQEWRSVLTTLGLRKSYEAHNEGYAGEQVSDFVLRSKHNPESVLRIYERARTNARVCRSAITMEVWEAVNEGWMTLRDMLARPVRDSNLNAVLAAIRRESTLARGATHGSMLRNETYGYARAGTFLERADNTARILDVKYYLLLPSIKDVGTPRDAGQWDNVLRSLSAERAYRWLNAGQMDARSISDFLILDAGFPRSLSYCFAAMRDNLVELARLHGKEGAALEAMRAADARLTETTFEEIFDQGLHQFLREVISSSAAIASAIAEEYRFTS